MLDVERRCVVIGERAAVCKSTRAVLTAGTAATICFSAVATVAAMRRIVRECCGIDNHAAGIGENRTATRGAAVESYVPAKAIGSKRIATATAGRAVQMKSGITDGRGAETIDSAAISFAAGIAAILARTGIAPGCGTTFNGGAIDGRGASADVSGATLRHPARSAILLIARTVAAITAGRVAGQDF